MCALYGVYIFISWNTNLTIKAFTATAVSPFNFSSLLLFESDGRTLASA
jgi:hypothetical protein